MKRVWLCATLVLVLLLVISPPLAQGATPTSDTAFPPGSAVVFVGYKVVDLMWDPVLDALSYRLERDPGADETIQPESIAGRLFYRDQQTPGTSLNYRVCAVWASSDTCSAWQNVQLGQVEGQLYKDLIWSDVVIELDGAVQIMNNTVLRITDQSAVSPAPLPSGNPVLMTTGSGVLQVGQESGAPPTLRDIQVEINDSEGLSDIGGVEGQLVILDNVQIRLYARADVEYTSLTNGATITVYQNPYSQAPSSISHNQFQYTRIRLEGGTADIHHNTFVCSDCIRLRDGAEATIADNVFDINYNSDGVDIGASQATVSGNEFRPDGYAPAGSTAGAIRVWPDSGDKLQITVANNTFAADDYRTGVGILLCRDTDHPSPPPIAAGAPDVIVGQNVFRELVRGVEVCNKINVQMSGNSLSDNSTAVSAASDCEAGRVLIYDNCIAGNLQGLYGPVGVNAQGNWWGSPLGPRNDTCDPLGAGDLVTGSAVRYPFLEQGNCDRRVTNLTVYKVEVTQAIQTPNNTVPLVAGKPAVVRVYPGSATGAVSGVGGKLVVRRGETQLGTLQSGVAVDTIYIAPACSSYAEYTLRSLREHSLVFKLPAEWMTGTLTLKAEVNPAHSIEEHDYSDNTKTLTVTVRQAPHPVRIGIVPVNPSGTQRQSTEATDVAALLQIGALFRTIYPGDTVTFTILPTVDWPYALPEPSLDPDSAKNGSLLLNVLGLAQQRLRAEGGWDGPAIDQMHGVILGADIEHSRSEPTVEGGRGTVAYSANDQVVLAAALSVNLGRTPWPNCSHIIGDWGYDLVTDRPVPPDTLSAFCLPENPADASLYTPPYDPSQFWAGLTGYQELLTYNTGTATTGIARTQTADPETYVLVGGVVNYNGEVVLMPAWQVTALELPLNPPVGSRYCLELLDVGDTVLSSHCFDLKWPTEYWKRWQGFEIALPLTGTPSRIVLWQGSTELGRIPVSAAAPSVTISGGGVARQAATSVLPISWSGQDGDGDDLVYSVLYSTDNGDTWLPVAANLTETQYDLNLAEVPGGAQVWVRVEASDGFHTAMDTLGPFVVDDHDPLAAIAQPPTGSIVSPTLTLLGYGYDQEDGELAGASLVWTSDREGQLGTGSMVFVQDLLTGTHRLTLTATDSLGHSAAASVLVGVEAPIESQQSFVFLPLVLRR